MERIKELTERKWNLEARMRICPNPKTKAKWMKDLKALEKMISLNKKVEKLRSVK